MEDYIVVQAPESVDFIKSIIDAANISFPDDHILQSSGRTSAIGDAGTILLSGDSRVALFLKPEQSFDFAEDMLSASAPPEWYLIAPTGIHPGTPEYVETQEKLKKLFGQKSALQPIRF